MTDDIPAPHTREIDLLTEVAGYVAQAKAEYAADCAIAARLEVLHAIRVLNRTYGCE